MKIGLMVAMDKEFEILAEEWAPYFKSNRVVVERYGLRYIKLLPTGYAGMVCLMQCGIGKVNATIGTIELARLGVDCIISSGVAGSLNKSILPGQIVVGAECKYHDVYCGEGNELGQVQGEPAIFKADRTLLDIAHRNPLPDTHYGMILTGDSFIDKKEVAEELCRCYRSVCAVDMESCAIAQVCNKMGIPFLSYRIISDCALNPSAISYEAFWEEMPHKMAKYTMSYVKNVIQKYKPF